VGWKSEINQASIALLFFTQLLDDSPSLQALSSNIIQINPLISPTHLNMQFTFAIIASILAHSVRAIPSSETKGPGLTKRIVVDFTVSSESGRQAS
jgi:hypothetical protein